MDDIIDSNVLELRQIVDGGLDIPAHTETAPKDTNPEPEKQAQIWTYFGAIGGAGVTSLAVQAAWELSSPDINGPRLDTVLVDLDFERGSCAAYLDTPPSMHLTELNSAEGRMDADLAATFITKVSPSLSLVSAHGELGGNDIVSTDALLALLDNISGLFDVIIIDVPPMWRPWTGAVIGAADQFALVTEARVPALHQTKKLAADIMEALELTNPPEVILSKFERRSLRGGLSLADAQKVLGDVSLSQICVDDETVRIAINTGKPAGALKPNSRYVKSVRAHVQDWYQGNLQIGAEFGAEPGKHNRRAARR